MGELSIPTPVDAVQPQVASSGEVLPAQPQLTTFQANSVRTDVVSLAKEQQQAAEIARGRMALGIEKSLPKLNLRFPSAAQLREGLAVPLVTERHLDAATSLVARYTDLRARVFPQAAEQARELFDHAFRVFTRGTPVQKSALLSRVIIEHGALVEGIQRRQADRSEAID